jgi:integrase
MPRPPKPYLHRGHYVTNVGGQRRKLCREEEGKAVARAAFLDVMRELRDNNGRPTPNLKVPQLAELYLSHRRGKIDDKNLENQTKWLARFAEEHKDRPARDITRLEAEAYIDGLAKRGWKTRYGQVKPYKPKTINHILTALRQMFRWGIDKDLLPAKNPWDRIRQLPWEGRQRVMTDEEWLSLLRHSGAHFRRVLLALRYTSLRPGELRALTWANVDWPNSRFVLHRHKTSRRTGKPRVVPFPPCLGNLLRWLQRRQDNAPSAHIFRNKWGRPWTDNHLSGYMDIVRQRAGIQPDANGERLTAYHHRHRFLTEAASSQHIEGIMLQRLAGHTSLAMTAHYAHLAGRTVGDAAARVAESLRPQRAREAQERKEEERVREAEREAEEKRAAELTQAVTQALRKAQGQAA